MLKTKKEIKNWLKKYNIKNYVINKDLTVDVYENVNLSYKRIREISVKFGFVLGCFYCNNNELTSLENCPEKINDSFDCSHNKLKSLKHCPGKIKGGFSCSFNHLISLEYCPKEIEGNFYCDYNELTSLEHCPEKIKKGCSCSANNLTSLKHIPEKINGDFDCSHNQLTSLAHCPKKIKGNFLCSDNKLTKKILYDFNSIVEKEIDSDFGNKEEFFNEVNKQKLLKEKEDLNKAVVVYNNSKNEKKRL